MTCGLICGYHPAGPQLLWLTYWVMESYLQIPQQLKNNVVFLGIMEDVNGPGGTVTQRFRPKATAFFVGVRDKFGDILYLVTAEHVIANLRLKGHEDVYVRTHIPNFPISKMSLSMWTFHPDAERTPVDVAVTPVYLRGTAPEDILVLDTLSFVTPDNIERRGWGVGDEVVVVGLFRNHFGTDRNIPIVRIGSLAAMPDEPVKTKWGFIEAYLVELHSIGGLSGSPVYIHHPPVRVRPPHYNAEFIHGERLNLLGVMQGHFDVPNLREDSALEEDDDSNRKESINTGVGVVVPAYKILETLNHPDLQAERKAAAERAAQGAASLE
jgi:hypothetical protein